MAHDYGLEKLHECEGEPVAQLVFVHGLFGHRRNTWTGKDGDRRVLWPQELLKQIQDLQNVDIYTWGYDANIDNFLSPASTNTLHQHANGLIWDLVNERTSARTRNARIIFIVHSLGGLVIKDALNQSAQTVGNEAKDLAPATHAICFLGTPHRGSSTATLGKIAFSVKTAVTKKPNLALMGALERNSAVLEQVSDAFTQTLERFHYGICSFREELETRKFGVFSSMVVETDSAKINHAQEVLGSIPADHTNMTKFTSIYDIGFKRICARLVSFIDLLKQSSAAAPGEIP